MPFAETRGESQQDNIVLFSAFQADECSTLTRGIVAGDESAAAEFFNRYFDRLFRYLVVIARGNEELAREALSDAFIKAARHMKPMKSDQDIWRWLTRIARTSLIDHVRKGQRRITIVFSDEPLPEPPAREPADKLTDALNECLVELPREDREVIEGFYFEDQSQAALAAERNSTGKAVESKLARIRQKLRVALLNKLA
jgi:RNA polymerase sigma factor (sigma-70 family)